MNAILRVAVIAVAAFLVVALLAWARGTPHHHGLDVGSLHPSGMTSSRSPALSLEPSIRK